MNVRDQFDIKDGSFSSHQSDAHIYFKQYFPKNIAKNSFHFILQHGAITYHANHNDFIEYLLKRFKNQIVISCMDLVGHGLSGGPRAYVKNFDVYEKDFITFNNIIYESTREYDLPVVMCGHSLGGMIIIKTLVEHKDKLPYRPKKVILINPCIKPKLTIPKSIMGKLKLISGLASKVRLPSIYGGSDLSSDSAKATSFDHDQLNSSFMTVGMGEQILNTSMKLINLSYYIDFPVLFITSDDDVIVDQNTTMLFMTGIKKELVTHHSFKGVKHDILNERNRNDVFKKIEDYMRDLL